MVGLISAAEAPSIRAALGVFLVHTYTRTPITDGAEDAHGVVARVPGTPATGVACKYRAADRVRLDDGGVTTILAPTIKVAAADPLAPGDQVLNIQNSEGAVLLAGPLTVGKRANSDGLGPTLSKRFVLRGAEVTD